MSPDIPASERAVRFSEPTPVKVQRRDVIGYEMLNGKLVTPAVSQAVVHPPFNAPVEQVFVTVGKRVRKGDVLMDLSFPDVEANYQMAGDAVRQAETAHANARSQFVAGVRAAEQQLTQARAAERSARSQTIPGGDASALAQAREARQAAELAVAQAKAEYQTNMLPYEQQLEQARAAFAGARSGAKQSQVKAPISGTVLEINAQPGQEVGRDAKEVLVRIVDLEELQVQAPLNDFQQGLIKERRPVVIAFQDVADKVFDGTVLQVRTLPAESGGLRYQATIAFRNDDGLIKPGAVVRYVGVQVGKAADVLAIPVEALDKDETGRPIVRVLEGQDWVVRVVEPGLSDGSFVEIKKGISEGETVQATP